MGRRGASELWEELLLSSDYWTLIHETSSPDFEWSLRIWKPLVFESLYDYFVQIVSLRDGFIKN